MDFLEEMKDQLTSNWRNWNSLEMTKEVWRKKLWNRLKKWENESEGEDGGKNERNKEGGVTIHHHPFVYNN